MEVDHSLAMQIWLNVKKWEEIKLSFFGSFIQFDFLYLRENV